MNIFEYLQTIPELQDTGFSRVYDRYPDETQSNVFAVVETGSEPIRERFYGRTSVGHKVLIVHLYDPRLDTDRIDIINAQNTILNGNTPILTLEKNVTTDITTGLAVINGVFFTDAYGPYANARVQAVHIRLMFKILLGRG